MTTQKTPVLPHRLAYELDWPVVRPAELSELAQVLRSNKGTGFGRKLLEKGADSIEMVLRFNPRGRTALERLAAERDTDLPGALAAGAAELIQAGYAKEPDGWSRERGQLACFTEEAVWEDYRAVRGTGAWLAKVRVLVAGRQMLVATFVGAETRLDHAEARRPERFELTVRDGRRDFEGSLCQLASIELLNPRTDFDMGTRLSVSGALAELRLPPLELVEDPENLEFIQPEVRLPVPFATVELVPLTNHFLPDDGLPKCTAHNDENED